MQEVRGSNPLSSTILAVQRHISIIEMTFDLLHAGERMSPDAQVPGTEVLAAQTRAAGRGRKKSRRMPRPGEQDGEQAESNHAICPSSATALREPELPGVLRPSATRCHHRGLCLSRNAMTERRS